VTYISAKRPRKGVPKDIMRISFTLKHGLGWGLFGKGSHVAHDFGRFILPGFLCPQEVADWALHRQALYDEGVWINPGRYDYLIDTGWFPEKVRRVDKAGCVRGRVPNGPVILSVLKGGLTMGPSENLKPSRECPDVSGWQYTYLVGGAEVAVQWMQRNKD